MDYSIVIKSIETELNKENKFEELNASVEEKMTSTQKVQLTSQKKESQRELYFQTDGRLHHALAHIQKNPKSDQELDIN